MIRIPFRRQALALCVLASGLVQCGGGDPAGPTVPPVTITSVSITPASASLISGESAKLTLAVTTSDGANSTALTPTWTSSATNVATVASDGNVVAVAPGSATISVAVGGKSASASVSVLSVATVAIAPVTAALVEGDTLTATALATLSNGTSSARTATWTSSAPTVASVSTAGRITALTAGTTNIVGTIGGVSGTAAVTVARRVASIAMNISARSLNPSETVTLVPTLKFSDSTAATGKTVAWASSAAAVATVSQTGVVTALSGGTANVTATVDGSVATTVIIVRAPATTTLNSAAAVTQTVGSNGGTLTTTAAGITYRLEVPAGALPTDVSIRMTPITSVGNLPLTGGLVAAVDLQPSGLRFSRAATLRVTVAAPPRAGLRLAGFSMNDDGTKVARELAGASANEVRIAIAHFTAAGAAFGTTQDVASLRTALTRSADAETSHQEFLTLATGETSGDAAALLRSLKGWFDDGVLPQIVDATTDDALRLALSEYDVWANWTFTNLPPLPFTASEPALSARRNEWLTVASEKILSAMKANNQLCIAQQNSNAMLNTLYWQQQAQLLGVASGELSRSSMLASFCAQVKTITSNLVDPVQSGFPNDLDASFGMQLGSGPITSQPVTVSFSADRAGVSFAKSSPANSNSQGAFTVAVTATGNAAFQVNLIACLTITGATDVCGQQSFNRTSLDVSGTYTGRFSSTIQTGSGTNFPVNVPLNVTLTQNQNGVTGTYDVMQFNGPRGTVSATLVGQQLLNFTLNQLSPCSGTLRGTANFTLSNRNIAAAYTGSDCTGTHSNGQSTLVPGTITLSDFNGAWTRGLHATGFPLELWRIVQNGTEVRMSFSTYNASQGAMECRALFRGTVSPGSEVFSATVTDRIGIPGEVFSTNARTSWSPDLTRQRGARISTTNAGQFSGTDNWFLTGNVPLGCVP